MNAGRSGLLSLVLLGTAVHANAQSVRVTGASWLQSIDLRPLRRDSVRLAATTDAQGVRRTADGTLVVCPEGSAWCTLLAAAPRQTTRPFIHDLSVAGWGLGEGVSFHAHGRARSAVGGTRASWPRLNDRFDLLDAYVEVDRAVGRVRLGRQWSLGGLGAYSYDGASVVLRRGSVDGELLGGQALVQGLNEPYTSEELGLVDDLPPERRAWMLGGRARWHRGSSAITATYLRIIQDDRSGLYAERAGADASFRMLGLRVATSVAYDVAADVLNEGRIRAVRRLTSATDVGLEVRRSRPFFELWTIWGAFAPVGFDEVRATTTWVIAQGTATASASGAWRTYEETGTGLVSVPLRTDGWRAALDATWTPDPQWSMAASYAADIGAGSSQSDGQVSAARQFGDRTAVGGSLSAMQTIYEYRVGTGRVLGVSGFATARIISDLALRVEAGRYSHRLTNDAPGRDWSQRRASVRLEWAVGADPGGSR